ncbi:ribonuclease HII [Methanosarcinales archaeon]|nr:MAG: ribonuclease HII [Methanosarcinales archaeon]
MTLIAGVDEAGKGPVIGPMCVGGVLTTDMGSLKKLGVNDSKKLTPEKREKLSEQIKNTADKTFVLEVSAAQIDEFRKAMTMNEVMVICFAGVLKELKPEFAYLDAADVKPERFGRLVGERYGHKIKIISEHYADEKYSVVSAASIIAKVKRDALLKELSIKMGLSVGSGYPSDPKTKRFLEDWIRTHKEFPPFVRKSWKTVSKYGRSK